MKKQMMLYTVFCATLITVAGAKAVLENSFDPGPSEVGAEALQTRAFTPTFTGLKVDLRKPDFRDIGPMRYVELDEADYEPNDWDGEVWPVSQPDWMGHIGPLPSWEAVILNGTLDSVGFEGGWYVGDTDLYGFSLPDEGILRMSVAFSPDCSEEANYNVWFMARDDQDYLWHLDFNFPHPYIGPVTCPFEGSYTIDPFGEIDPDLHPGHFFTNSFFLYIGSSDGDPPAYTITWHFSDCDDLDGDGYYNLICSGSDCDDTDPNTHPCAFEEPGSGDTDCSGSDRQLVGGQVSEDEPNDDETIAQNLGDLDFGECVVVVGNHCSASDSDYYRVDLPPADLALTITLIYKGITEELACLAIDGANHGEDYGFGIAPGDLDEDGYVDKGDYYLIVCAEVAEDADGDGWYSEAACGDDCNDTDPDVNPCDPELEAACGDGVDDDCTGIELTLDILFNGLIFPNPDGDLDCGGIDEVEPNDDISAGLSHDLGVLTEGVTPIYGALSDVGYEPGTGYTGDFDFYQFELPGAGFLFAQLMFACRSDYDLFLLAFTDPDGPETQYELDWHVIDSDALIYVPEMLGGAMTEEEGWEFPLQMAFQVVGYGADPADTGNYTLELFWDAACVDGDGDGYGGGADPDFEAIYEATGDCEDIDCDDTDPLVNPGATEGPEGSPTCDDGKDNDCDGLIDWSWSTGDPDCEPGSCEASIMPVAGRPILFYLIPVLLIVFVARHLRR